MEINSLIFVSHLSFDNSVIAGISDIERSILRNGDPFRPFKYPIPSSGSATQRYILT